MPTRSDAAGWPAAAPNPQGAAGRRAIGAALAGALFAAAGAAALGLALDQLGRHPGPARAAAERFRDFLNAGGWLWLPLWGGALGALRALAWARRARERALPLAIAVGLLALAGVSRPALRAGGSTGAPGPGAGARGARGVAARLAAIRRWSYASTQGVREILAASRDPSPLLREQAALALGVNLIVSDIEYAGPRPGCAACPPSRFASHPLRDSLRQRLGELMGDSIEAVRAEAARALWKAPVTFGPQPAAAVTLSAVLERADRPGTPERLAWLALDAAAGSPDPRLKRAAARFAASTRDSALGRAARHAAAPRRPGP